MVNLIFDLSTTGITNRNHIVINPAALKITNRESDPQSPNSSQPNRSVCFFLEKLRQPPHLHKFAYHSRSFIFLVAVT